MLYYHTEAQRQMLREHAEQLTREMRRNPDPTTPDVGRDRRTGGVMISRLSRRLMIAFGLVLTIAALAAPSANAKIRPVYSDHGVALIASSSEPNPNLACSDQGCIPIQPDSKPKPSQVCSDQGCIPIQHDSKPKPSQVCSDQGCIPISPPQSEPNQVPNVSDNPSGFDWSKTGFIVSLSMVGLLLLGGGGLLAGKHNRRRRRRLAAA
jgi:hypothetical protein